MVFKGSTTMDKDTAWTREEFLMPAGYCCDSGEPYVPNGRHPDLFCSGPHPMWVEVKRVDPTPHERKIARYGRQIESALEDMDVSASCIQWISHNANDRHLKILKKMLKIIFSKHRPTMILLLVQFSGRDNEYIKFNLPTDFGVLDTLSSAVSDGAYGLPEGIALAPGTKSVLSTDMREDTARLDPRCWSTRTVALGIEITVGGHGLRVHDMSGGLRRDRTVYDVRSRIKDAEKQLKNGLKYREAPCLLVLRAGSMFSDDPRLIGAALYRQHDDWSIIGWPQDCPSQGCGHSAR
jgi:hypothetical protein